MTARLQPLDDIGERIDLLKMTLGLFPPDEPAPIAAELVELSSHVLMHWLAGRGIAPADGEGLAALQRRAAAADPALADVAAPVQALVRLADEVVQAPDHDDTQARLVAAAEAAGDILARVRPRLAGGRASLACVVALLCALLTLLVAAPSMAEEVSTRYRGLTILGNLELADGRAMEDGVALIVHGTMAHAGMEIIAALQKDLKAKGLSSLAITLSLGQNERRGFFDCGKLHAYRPYDALDEIDAWIGWLKNNGATDIVLIGHSLGGNQVAVYGAERRDPSLSALVLLAPSTFDFERVAEAYKARYEVELPPLLDKAQALVRSGEAVEHMEGVGFLSCPNATVTAGSFAAWYAPSTLRNTPAMLPREPMRTLVIVAGNDEVVPDLAAAVAKAPRPASRGKGEITVKTVDGADHFFRDIYIDDAADLIADWLKG